MRRRILAAWFGSNAVQTVWQWLASAGLVEQRLYVTVSDAATSTCTLVESGWTCTLTDAAVR